MPPGEAPLLDFWFDLASPYSYLAATRIGAVAAGVDVRWRPFPLGVIFKAQGWDTSPFNIYPAKGRYMWRDLERCCAALGVPFKRPDPFPQHSLLATRVALIATDDGFGEAFCRAVFIAEFAEGRPISEPAVIADLLGALGHDADGILARAQSEINKLRLRAVADEAQRFGLFGAPSFVAADGELFWGNDRPDDAIAWATWLAR